MIFPLNQIPESSIQSLFLHRSPFLGIKPPICINLPCLFGQLHPVSAHYTSIYQMCFPNIFHQYNPGLRRKLRLRLLQHHGQAALHGAHARRQLLQPREHLRWAMGGSNWKRPLGTGNKGSTILGKNSKTSWKVAVERAFSFDFGFNLELG